MAALLRKTLWFKCLASLAGALESQGLAQGFAAAAAALEVLVTKGNMGKCGLGGPKTDVVGAACRWPLELLPPPSACLPPAFLAAIPKG